MQAIILPHVLFSTLYHHYPSTWRKRICPSSEVLVEFWQAAENHPQMKDHPLLSQENYQAKTIPLAMHGDGTAATGIGKVWAKMMTILGLTSLVGYGSTLENISGCILFSTACVCKVSLVLGLLFLQSLLGVSHGSSKGCGLTEITKARSIL